MGGISLWLCPRRLLQAGEPEEDPNFDMATLKLILGKTDGGAGESSSTDSPEPHSPTIMPAANPPPTLLLSPVNEEKNREPPSHPPTLSNRASPRLQLRLRTPSLG